MLRSLDTDEIEQKVFHDTSKMISEYVNLKQENILEIGTSTGKFLTYLKKNFNSKTFFDELNLEALNLLSSQSHSSNKDLPPNEKYKLELGKFGQDLDKPENSYLKGDCPITEEMYYNKMIITPLVREPLTEIDLMDLITALKKIIRNVKLLKSNYKETDIKITGTA